MACIQWDSQQFYQSPFTPSSSTMHSLSRNPKAAPAAAANVRPSGAAISIGQETISAKHSVAQSTVRASWDQAELFPSERQVSNSVGTPRTPSQSTSLYPVTSPDDPILLDENVSNDEKTDTSLHRAHPQYEPSGRTGTLPFTSLKISSECRETDENIPIILSDLQVMKVYTPMEPIPAYLINPPPNAPLKASQQEAEGGLHLIASSKKAGLPHKREGAPTSKGEIDKSRWEPRASKSGDRGAQSHEQSNDDGEFNVDAGSRHDDEGELNFDAGSMHEENDSDDDPEDEDYAGNSDAASSDTEKRPRPPKRRKWEKDTEDAAGATSSASEQASFTNSIDVSSQATGAASSVISQESEEIPIRGFLTLKTFESKVLYCLTFSQELSPHAPETVPGRYATTDASRNGDRMDNPRSPPRESSVGRAGRQSTFTAEDDARLVQLKEERCLSWAKIADHFPDRKMGTLRAHYNIKLKQGSERPQRARKR